MKQVTIQATATDDVGVTSVEVAVGGGARQAMTSAGGNAYTAQLELPFGNRTVTVYAKDAANNEGSASRSFEVWDEAAVTGLTATPGNTQVSLSWAAKSSRDYYRVFRATSENGTYTQVGGNITGATYTDTGLTNGTTYWYIVRAYRGGLVSADSAKVSATPAAPVVTPSYVNAAAFSSSSNILMATPSGAQVGDTLLLALVIQSTTAFYETLEGWTEVGLWRNGSSTIQIFRRQVADPQASYTFVLNGSSTTRRNILAAYRNVNADAIAAVARNASYILPSIDVAISHARLVGFWSHTGTGSVNEITPPAPLATRFAGQVSLADLLVAPGASGTHTATTAAVSAVPNAVALILRPT